MTKLIDEVNKEYLGMLSNTQNGKTAKEQMAILDREMLAHKFTLDHRGTHPTTCIL